MAWSDVIGACPCGPDYLGMEIRGPVSAAVDWPGSWFLVMCLILIPFCKVEGGRLHRRSIHKPHSLRLRPHFFLLYPIESDFHSVRLSASPEFGSQSHLLTSARTLVSPNYHVSHPTPSCQRRVGLRLCLSSSLALDKLTNNRHFFFIHFPLGYKITLRLIVPLVLFTKVKGQGRE